MKDFVRDVLSSVRMSRRRGVLSGIMTVWGVFIFIVIVGISNGIDRGNRSNFDYLIEYGIISVRPGEISIPHNGHVKGRKISLTRSDAEELETLFSGRSQHVYPRKWIVTDCESLTGSADVAVSDFRKGLNEMYMRIIAGRSFFQTELTGKSRICIVPETVAVQLFGSADGAVDGIIVIDGLPYTVLGVYTTVHNVSIRSVFVPFETVMAMQGADESLSSIDIKLLPGMPVSEKYRLKNDIASWLYFKKGISADDVSALHLEESIDFISAQEKLLDSVRLFTVSLGLLSVLMGILGVSSIVHLSVRERTREIAVRLVCGSSESSIFRLILGESVMIMAVFGLIGMLLGSAALKAGNMLTERMNEGASWVFIGDLTVSWQLILSATVLIVVCGLIAGYAPARKATAVRINEAMDYE